MIRFIKNRINEIESSDLVLVRVIQSLQLCLWGRVEWGLKGLNSGLPEGSGLL